MKRFYINEENNFLKNVYVRYASDNYVTVSFEVLRYRYIYLLSKKEGVSNVDSTKQAGLGILFVRFPSVKSLSNEMLTS